VAIKACINKAGGGVNQKAKAAKRALSLNTGNQIVWYCNALESGPKDKFARVQNKHAIKWNVHQFGEVSHVLLYVDDASGVVAEYAKQVVHLDIDAAWLHARFIEWLDDDTASG
jgi:hypothetical protein